MATNVREIVKKMDKPKQLVTLERANFDAGMALVRFALVNNVDENQAHFFMRELRQQMRELCVRHGFKFE